MRLLSLFVLHFFVAAFLFAGCGRRQESPLHRWPEAGAEFDSLTDRLEWQFNDFALFDSILQSVDCMDSLAEADNANYKLKKSRALYWRSRYFDRIHESDSSLRLIKKALFLNDSIKYRYDHLKMLSILYIVSDTIDGGSEYRHFSECLEYAHEIGDKAFEAYAAINLGNIMDYIGEYEKALYYFRLADSINNDIGYKKVSVKNKINVARVFSNMGDKEKGDSILKSLVGHPAIAEDTFMNNLLSRNIYGNQGRDSDVGYLYRAYNEIKDNERYRYLRGLYHALLVDYSYRQGRYDSVRYYAEKTKVDLPYIRDYGHRGIAGFGLGLSCSVRGDSDSALLCLVMYEAYADSARMRQRSQEVLRLSAVHEIWARDARYEAEMFRRNMITAFIAVVLLAGGAVAALVLHRRHLRQKMAAMENELKLEKTQKKMAATALAIEEKDRMLDVVKTELSDMRREGEIKEGNARRLESTIKSHLLEHESNGTFLEMIDVVNPGFTDRLRERCPDLSDSYLKLACYMLMEFDSKRIASLMMIKPESVRQSRWRLSQKLRVPEGETLEAFLRRLNKP